MNDPLVSFLKCYEELDRQDQPFRFFITTFLTDGLRNQLPKFTQENYKEASVISFIIDKRMEPMLMVNDERLSVRLHFSGVNAYLDIPLRSIMEIRDEFNQYIFVNAGAEKMNTSKEESQKEQKKKRPNHLKVVK